MTIQKVQSIRSSKDDARLEMQNLVFLYMGWVVVPFGLWVILGNPVLALSITFLFTGMILDLSLTNLGIKQGYREQNFYRFLLSRLGDKNGFVVIVLLNIIIRALITLVFYPNQLWILLSAFVSFVGPLWNALTFQSFYDDFVLETPTIVNIQGNSEITLDNGDKKRLEQMKDFQENTDGDVEGRR